MKPYPKYKDSGIEWLGKVPEGWEVSYLKNIGRFSASGIDKKIIEGESLVRMVNYMDIYGNDTKLIDNERELMTVSCPEWKIAECNLIKGDLVFTPSSETSEDIGLSALITENLTNAVFSYHVVRFRFKKVFNHNFKRYICNNTFVLQQFTKASRGTTRQILDRSDFKNITVVIPPFEEQKRISTFLDHKTTKIDELIKKDEKLIELLKEKRQAVISHAVTKGLNPNANMKDSGIEWIGEVPEGWGVKRLKFNLQLLTKKTDRRENPVALENIESWLGRYKETESEFQGEGVAFKKGDILFGKLRPYLAKAWLADFSGEAIGDFFVMRPLVDIDGRFAVYQILNKGFISIVDGSTFGAKMPRVSWDFMANLRLPTPSIEEQHAIADYLDRETVKIDGIISKIQSQIAVLKEYRQALISNVVTGKVKVS